MFTRSVCPSRPWAALFQLGHGYVLRLRFRHKFVSGKDIVAAITPAITALKTPRLETPPPATRSRSNQTATKIKKKRSAFSQMDLIPMPLLDSLL